MNILIAGGAGFIGSNLITWFMETTDDNIICVDNLSTGSYENIKKHLNNSRFTVIHHDVIYPIDLEVDYIYIILHLRPHLNYIN